MDPARLGRQRRDDGRPKTALSDVSGLRCLVVLGRRQQAADAVAFCHAARSARAQPALASSAWFPEFGSLPEGIVPSDLSGAALARVSGGEATAGPGRRSLRGPVLFAALLLRIRQSRARLRRLLMQSRPDVVVVFDDRPIVPETVLIDLMQRELPGTPVVLISTAISLKDGRLATRRGRKAYRVEAGALAPLKRHLARRLPGQVADDDGDQLLFFTFWELLALVTTDLAGGSPWVQGDRVEMTCCLGPDDRDRMVAEGADPDRLLVTGQISLDPLHGRFANRLRLRDDLCRRHGLDRNRPLVVCAVPQLLEDGLVDRAGHQRSTGGLFAALAAAPVEVLLSLHPKSARADYQRLADEHGLPIVEEPISELLPVCDLLVATYSSTVRWALMMGLPALVIDDIGRDYTVFNGLAGVTIAKSPCAAGELLARFGDDPKWRAAWEGRARGDSARIAVFDGRAGARTLAALAGLVGQRRAKTTEAH